MVDVTDGLNASQRRAVVATEGHLLVAAGPGTGKTMTIVRRCALLLGQGFGPEEILAVTFTNRAAREMRERMRAFLGPEAARLFVGTLHLLGLKIMRAAGETVGLCTRDEQVRLLRSVTASSRAALQLAERISRVKNLVEVPDPETTRLLETYRGLLRAQGLYDFDDLIAVPTRMLEAGRVPAAYAGRFKHIIVDEYQDISPVQQKLLGQLVSKGARICAVGDSDQAIYAFRGADVRNFLCFATDFPGAATVALTENYRSTGMIVRAACSVVRNNRQRLEKELYAVREEGTPITVCSVPDERAEAETVVREIEARMGPSSHFMLDRAKAAVDFSDRSSSFADFAVLYRTNGQARVFKEAFMERGIPFQAVGGKGPSRRKALIEELRGQLDTMPDRQDMDAFWRGLREKGSFPDEEWGLLHNLALAYQDLSPRDALGEVINELTLFTTADDFDARAEAVALMTLHAAKGLEFKCVFVAGVEEGLIPFTSGPEGTDMEEERRLFFVGMTRARDELFLLHARRRFLYGRQGSGLPSPFLAEIPRQLMRQERVADGVKKKGGTQMGLFS